MWEHEGREQLFFFFFFLLSRNERIKVVCENPSLELKAEVDLNGRVRNNGLLARNS